MEAVGIRRERADGGAQALLIATLFVLAAVGWAVTDDRMRGMDAGPGTDLGALGFYVTAWVVMMAAMMFPSIAPMVAVYRRVQARRRELGRAVKPLATAVFVAGYLICWTVFGLAAYALIELFASLDIDALSWDRGGPCLAGGVIVAAAAYELTPAKDACLRRCRSPLDFVMNEWREGLPGALRMGVLHGAWCVGCCWGLMAALFALGVMSVGWMVFIAALIAIEKLVPWKATPAIAALLVVLGVAVALAPEDVPGLTLPDSGAMQMEMDGGGAMPMEMERDGGAMPMR